MRSAQPALAAKRCHALSAFGLLGNQLPPLRPCLLPTLGHGASLLSSLVAAQDGVQISLTESGNDYAQARIYISRLGRFNSPDPISGMPDFPQSLNRY